MEEYRKIEDFENYSISNLGNVKNDKTGRILKQYKKANGYMQVQMGRKTIPQYVHRLVAKAFIPNIYNKEQVDHINGNKSDNRAENIRWVSASENAFAYGYRERIENKKKKIIAIYIDGTELEFNSRNETAKYFKCSKSQITYGKVYKKGNKKGWIFKLKI